MYICDFDFCCGECWVCPISNTCSASCLSVYDDDISDYDECEVFSDLSDYFE